MTLQQNPYPTTMSVPQAARFLGVGRTAMYVAIKRDEIPAVRINGRLYVPTAQLCEMVGIDPVAYFGNSQST